MASINASGLPEAPQPKTESAAIPRSLPVYPSTADEARRMLDETRDALRQWILTSKILYDETVALRGLLEAERRKHGPKA